MKILTKLGLVLTVWLAVPLANLFAGSHYDSIQASAGGWMSNPYPGSRSGEITAPAGAEVYWGVDTSSYGFSSSYAYVSGSGIFFISMSASNGQSDSDYAFFPTGGGTLYYYLTANCQVYDNNSFSNANAYIGAGW